MECVLADEAMDMGGEFSSDAWDSILVSLYGDVDLSDYDTEQPIDDVAIQGDSLEPQD